MEAKIVVLLKAFVPLLLLVVGLIFQIFFAERWIIESTLRPIKWVVVVFVVLAIVGYLVYRPSDLGESGALLFFALLFAAMIGFSGFQLYNCVGDDSPAETVDVERVKLRRLVTFRVTSGPEAGLEFDCSQTAWGPELVKNHRLELRRGRLGVWWGRLL